MSNDHMTDPIVRALDRHLGELDLQDAIDQYAEHLQEQDAHLDRATAQELAEHELRERAEEAAVEAAIEARAETMHDDYYQGG